MKRVIISGYFNPLHGGHLDYIEGAKALGDYLIVIVHNDKAQMIKKGKIILNQENRMRLINALQDVDEAILSIDEDLGQTKTLHKIREIYPHDELIYANGGDRKSNTLPHEEKQSCQECNFITAFGIGSERVKKRDSSTRINQAIGLET